MTDSAGHAEQRPRFIVTGLLLFSFAAACAASLGAFQAGALAAESAEALPARLLTLGFGNVGAWALIAAAICASGELLYGTSLGRLALSVAGFSLMSVAVAAMAAMPFSAELPGRSAFEAGGLIGSAIVHYDAFGLPWRIGHVPTALLLGLVTISGTLVGVPGLGMKTFRVAWRGATGRDWKPCERRRPGLELMTTETGGRAYTVPQSQRLEVRPWSTLRSAASVLPPGARKPARPPQAATPEAPAAAPAPPHPEPPQQEPSPSPGFFEAAAEFAGDVQLSDRAAGRSMSDKNLHDWPVDDFAAALQAPQVQQQSPPRESAQSGALASAARNLPPGMARSFGSAPQNDEPMSSPEAPQIPAAPPATPPAQPPSESPPRIVRTSSRDERAAESESTEAKPRILALHTDQMKRPRIDPAKETADNSWIEEFPPADWFEGYEPPPLSLLKETHEQPPARSDEELLAQARLLERSLADFGVQARVGEVIQGPVVTLFEIRLAAGTKLSKITSLENDLAIALAAPRVRILAPIPGKSAVGVEIPNEHAASVTLREIVSSQNFWRDQSPLLFALGVAIDGSHFICDLARMPHLLIAGATGAGKSVTLNSIISSILFHMAPTMVRLVLIDPKRVELSIYADVPHLAAPVISEPEEAAEALAWAVEIMEERCRRLQRMRVRNIQKYNQIALGQRKPPRPGMERPAYLPHMVIVIDELADLMLTNRSEIEGSLVRLAQKARAVGIHLVVATQRPSVDVITGLIRANFPSRIAFQVSSKVDSRIIIDTNGAECLLGRGDMLFAPGGALKPVRLQGAYVSEDEVEGLVEFLRKRAKPYYLREDFTPEAEEEESGAISDELYYEALKTVLENGQATQAALTSRLHIGRTNAGRLLDRMEREGYLERRGRMMEVSSEAEEIARRQNGNARDRLSG